jgi:ribosome-associated toxin RatA of RatAB toxin-antitoxin module
MPLVEKSALVAHTPAEMFELVDRVEEYPLFLPWCGGTELHERTDGRTVATIRINYHGLKLHFSTENTKQAVSAMHMKLREGPFQRMTGDWRFTPLGDQACKVEFRLDYEFSSKLVQKTLGPVFNKITETFVDSFVKRARQLYGG